MSSHWSIFATLRARARWGIALEAAAVLALAFAIYLGVTYAVDRHFRLEWPFRLAMLLALLWYAARTIYFRLARPIAVELTDDELALAVERRDPELRQELISAVQFDRALLAGIPAAHGESTELMASVVSGVRDKLNRMPVHRALEGRRLSKFAGILLVSTALLVTAAVFLDLPLWARRNLLLSAEEWPRYTQFEWQVPQTRVPQGDPLTLQVEVSGPVPDQVWLNYEFAGGDTGTDMMSQTGDAALFTLELESVLENLTVQVEGGDGLSAPLEIVVVERPRIEDVKLTIHYPAYMGQEPRVIDSTKGEIPMPAGCRVAVEGSSHKPLREAFLLVGQGDKRALELVGDHGFGGSVSPDESVLVTVDVIDRDGLGAGTPPKMFLRLADDEEPRVDFRTVGIGNLITMRARIPGELRVGDDFGLRNLTSDFRIAGRPEALAGDDSGAEPDPAGAPWSRAEVSGIDQFEAGRLEFEVATVFDLLPMAKDPEDETSDRNPVQPGHLVSLRFRAEDNFGPGDPHVGESEVLTFRVVTATKMVEELMRRQIEQRGEVLQVLATEVEHLAMVKEILNPTSEDDRAARARTRLRAAAREQKALGRRVQLVAERYDQIIAEYRNNRLLSAAKAAELVAGIVTPLADLAAGEIPASAGDLTRFAATGQEDARADAVKAYEAIVQRLEMVLQNMADAENLAALIETLRQVIKLEESAIEDVKRRLEEAGAGIFDTPPDKNSDGKNP